MAIHCAVIARLDFEASLLWMGNSQSACLPGFEARSCSFPFLVQPLHHTKRDPLRPLHPLNAMPDWLTGFRCLPQPDLSIVSQNVSNVVSVYDNIG